MMVYMIVYKNINNINKLTCPVLMIANKSKQKEPKSSFVYKHWSPGLDQFLGWILEIKV